MAITFDFSGQTAIVTGGTRGIGRAIAEQFLAAGASVIAIYAKNEEAAQEFAQKNSAHGTRVSIAKLDVGDYEQVEAFFQNLERAKQSIQILVNNSGIRRDAVMAMMKPQDWQAVINTNLNGTFNMSRFAVRMMMSNRFGRIINITSPSGEIGLEGQSNYAASKAGQVGLTRSLSKEVASRGITVNCVSPGFIDTELIRDVPEKLRDHYLSQIPLRRFGTPEDVAATVLFLASKEAAYVTGATFDVTGGL